MGKKARYEPLPYDDDQFILDSGRAFAQAAQALDVLFQDAENNKDRDKMSDVAAMWMRMGDSLGTEAEEPEGHEFPLKDTGNGTGFKIDTKEELDGDEG